VDVRHFELISRAIFRHSLILSCDICIDLRCERVPHGPTDAMHANSHQTPLQPIFELQNTERERKVEGIYNISRQTIKWIFVTPGERGIIPAAERSAVNVFINKYMPNEQVNVNFAFFMVIREIIIVRRRDSPAIFNGPAMMAAIKTHTN